MDDGASVELPRYRCHKEVSAAKITATERIEAGSKLRLILGEVGGYQDVDAGWVSKHTPEEGGYLVIYSDGYMSFSPAAAFEQGYRLITADEPSDTLDAQGDAAQPVPS